MNKPTNRTVNINDITVDYKLNCRDEKNYDLFPLMEQIVDAGRIIKSIMVKEEGGKLIALAGNRRTLAGQALYAQPEISPELKDALSKVIVTVYKGLTPVEELQIIFDHGQEKPISRSEIVSSVWRLDKEMYSESQIMSLMYFALADYTGNKKKLQTLSADPKLRKVELHKWLHGTVGGYILAAAKMGPYVRDQFLLTDKSIDGLLNVGEAVECRMTRVRITALSAAKNDEKEVWTPQNGSPKFNKLIEQYKLEDAGEVTKPAPRPSAKQLEETADKFFSPMLRKAFLLASGEKSDRTAGLTDDDAEYTRIHECHEVVFDNLDTLREKNPEVANLLSSIVNGGTPADVLARMIELIATESVTV